MNITKFRAIFLTGIFLFGCLFLSVLPQYAYAQEGQFDQWTSADNSAASISTTNESFPATTGNFIQDNQANKGTQHNKGTSNDRLFFTLPNFLTLENAGQVPPLTAGQKFKAQTRSSFDYAEYPWYGFQASLSQAENSESAYGHGASGYARRYGAAFADGTMENYFTNAIFPSVLHQDPRFFQSEKGGFWHRTGYAVSRIFVTRSDSGNNQFNYSEIFGSAVSSAISTYSYHPREDKTLRNTASVWGTQVMWDTVTYVVKEFWPDIRRTIHKDKSSYK
jgi:hypothetical protein